MVRSDFRRILLHSTKRRSTAYAPPDSIIPATATMKLSNSLLVAATTVSACSTSVSAFVHGGSANKLSPSTPSVVSPLQNARVDTSEAIQEAMAASKEFGATSKEARLAWEAVEEMDASDNSIATKGSLDVECATDDEQACKDYEARLKGLSKRLQQNQPKFESMRTLLVTELEQIKMIDPKSSSGDDSPQLRQALADAKAISEEKGATSKEAAVAWDIVEEIAAAGTGGSTGISLEDECLVETAMEACKALEELNRVMETRYQKSNA